MDKAASSMDYQQLATALFTDESRFLMDNLERRRRVWRPEMRGTRTASLLNITVMEEKVSWYGAAYLFVPVQSCLCLTEL